MKYKVLIVEDEPDIVRLIQNRLDKEKFEVSVALNGEEALALIQKYHFDVLTLDIMLPYINGLTLCEKIRKKHKDSLILIISALDTIEKKERAYELGADDYIDKPFSPKLLALKILSLLKRREELAQTSLSSFNTIATLQHDENLKLFLLNKKKLALTVSEYTILKILFDTPKRVFSKEELSQLLYNDNIGNIDKKGIGTHIYQIRKKMALLGENEMIKTIRSLGYTLHEC